MGGLTSSEASSPSSTLEPMELFRITLWRALLQDLVEGDCDSAESGKDNENDVSCFSQASSDFDLAPAAGTLKSAIPSTGSSKSFIDSWFCI